MTLRHQKEIRIINSCGAIYDEDLLKNAILWYSSIMGHTKTTE